MQRISLLKIVCFISFAVSSLFLPFSTLNAAGPTYVGGTYGTNQKWSPDGSPYIVTSDVIITSCATLTITVKKADGSEAPVEVRFNPGKGLRLGSGTLYSKSYGILSAQGSANAPITFTTNSPGTYWKGIDFRWNPSEQCTGPFNSMKYCIVEYGGVEDTYSGRGNISLLCSDATIDHCTSRNSLHDGIYINTGDLNINCYGKILNSVITGNPECGINIHTGGGSGYCYPIFNGNEISMNGTYGIYCNNKRCNPDIQGGNAFLQNGSYPLRIPAFMRLSSGNTFTGNGQQDIEVIGTDILENKIWHNFTIPYRIRESNITIGGGVGTTLTLTIEPGTTVRFDPGFGLYLGKGDIYNKSYGVLNAQGTTENPITFTVSEPGQYWDGILFKWGTSASNSRLNYCTVEYGGNPKPSPYNDLDGAVSFWSGMPSIDTIKNSTIRYSHTDGIRFKNQPSDNGTIGTIRNCNIHTNEFYDISDFQNIDSIHAELNYWGTPNGPSQDLCSSAVVSATVLYEAWLEKEFSDPLQFMSASANPKQFNPITGSTTFTFLLSQPGNWTLSVLNQQFEKVWSQSGTNSSGGTITWNGMGDNGVVSGVCYYRIEAENDQGSASPAMGTLNLGDQTIARITQPLSHTLFTPGTVISIEGTAITNGGYYEVKYGIGEVPASWNTITGTIYSSKQNEQLATWNTTGLNQPVYTIRLDVNNSGTTYSDLVTVNFLIAETQPPPDAAIAYTYDSLGRLTGARYPDGSSIRYTYDRVGNRLMVTRDGQLPPTLVHLTYFRAQPTPQGILLLWKTESEIHTEGFNLYRKLTGENEYTKINQSLIPAQGSSTSGSDYSFLDLTPQKSATWEYLLEEVDDAGNTRRYGPVPVKDIALRDQSGRGIFKKSFTSTCH